MTLNKNYPWLKDEDPFPWSILDGWHPLLNGLLADIGREMSRFPDAILHVRQVKEKMGSLRFYFDLSIHSDILLNGILDCIEKAEAKSFEICEECGEPGKLRDTNGWYAVRCDRHAPPGSRICTFEED